MFTDFVNLDDVGVLHPGQDLAFFSKALEALPHDPGTGQNHFEGDQTSRSILASRKDCPHAALAYLFNDFVVADPRPCQVQ